LSPYDRTEAIMTGVDRSEKLIWGNVVFLVFVPLALLVAVPMYIAEHGLSWANIITFGVLWWATGLSITGGYHRLFSHRAYKARWPTRLFFAIFGAAACENSAITWCAGHRFHHRDVDTDGDPYNAKRGFLWSHMGWIMVEGPRHDQIENVPDLWADPICRWQHNHFWKIVLAVNLGIPFLVGSLTGAPFGLVLIAGLTRIVLLQHTTFCVNSLAHRFGTQPWSDANSSRDSWLLSFLTFGEGYHNYHHAFQRDYRNGPLWYNFDPTKWAIWSLSCVGMAHELTRTPRDVVLRRAYEEEHARFSAWRARLSSRMDDLAGRMRDERQTMLLNLERQVDEAQSRLDDALEELTATRKGWMRAARARKSHLNDVSRVELREMRKAVTYRTRAAQVLLQEWKSSAAVMAQSLEAHPA
jgi:stearoyl-CoA desaturase (delta-9 desaturase)